MKGQFNYPTQCIYKGKTYRILMIDLQGGFFTLHDPNEGVLDLIDIEACEPVTANLNAFKILAKETKTGRQYKKKVYISEESYLKYKDPILRRWGQYYNMYCYECVNGTWVQIHEQLCKKKGS